jgi:MoaA/NifB/PqqE/SkfB family radical SAM enzyme
MIIPCESNSSWSVFLTLKCNFSCAFCIQKTAGKIPSYNLASGKDWISALNSIEDRRKRKFLFLNKVKKISLIGGEPTLHPDFFEIINSLDYDWNITITSNLGSPAFDNISEFAKKLKRRRKFRIHASFHEGPIDEIEFIKKIKGLKQAGILVNRIFTVCWPPDNLERFNQYGRTFKANGLFLEKQRYNGFYKEKFYPFTGDEAAFEFKDNIKNYDEYSKGCSMTARKEILCRMNKVLFAPDGTIYNCHYKLYSKSSDSYGNIFSTDAKVHIPEDYFPCSDYGFCNPCDWPYAKFMNPK